MGAEEKVYWNSYQDYLSWAIDNAKAGWNLFNKDTFNKTGYRHH